MSLDDPLVDGQTNTAAWVLRACVSSLEEAKSPLGILRLDPDAVVLNREPSLSAVALRSHMNSWRFRFASILDGITDEVFKQLRQLRGSGWTRSNALTEFTLVAHAPFTGPIETCSVIRPS